VNAVVTALTSGSNSGYQPSQGHGPCRAAVAEAFTTPGRAALMPSDVFMTLGCSEALSHCIAALAANGSNMLLPRPGFPLYQVLCAYHGVEVRYYDLLPEVGWQVDVASLAKLADENTCAILINNPSNPCGAVYTREHLVEIMASAEELGIPVIADEATMASRQMKTSVAVAVAGAAAAGALWASCAFVPSATPTLRGAAPATAVAREQPLSQAGGQGSVAIPVLAVGATAAALLSGSRRGDKAAAPSISACRAFESEIGATLPMKYFDPLGMTKDGDKDAFFRRRCAEIKNGRVAMFACMGYIAPEYFRWPGFCSPSQELKFADIPNGVAALYKMPAEGWAQIGVFVAFLELFPMRQEKGRIAGDAPGFGRLGVPIFASVADPEKNKRSLDSELNNGRLAMMAITGMVAQNGFLGTTGSAMWLPGASAFESDS
ncbi:unnamed protein product, partial [Polarella glacialis]